MLCFPLPHEDEPIYSIIARAGVVLGEVAYKEVLDAVAGNRNYVATLDLPSNLNAIAGNYPDCLNINTERLMFKHTLLPLYAPFIEPAILSSVMKSMSMAGKGGVHNATGANASIVNIKKHIFICPSCLTNQFNSGKMLYLKRGWQVPGVECCLEHGQLINTGIKVGISHRHQFKVISNEYCRLETENPPQGSSDG